MRTNWSAKDQVKNQEQSERIPGRPLGDLARSALRSSPIALLLFLVVAGGLVAGVRFLPADYRSSAVLMITARGGDPTQTAPTDAATHSALVDAEVDTLNAPAMVDKIFAQLRQKGGDHAVALAGSSGAAATVKARRRGKTYLVDVEARAATPETAKAIVEAAIETYQDRQFDQRFAALSADQAAPLASATAADGPARAGSAAEIARLEAEKARLWAAAAEPAVSTVAPDSTRVAALAQARDDAAAIKILLRSEVTPVDVAAFRASGAIDRLNEEGAALTKELLAYEAAMSAPADDPAKADDVKFHKYQILTESARLSPTLDSRVSRLASVPAVVTTPKPSSDVEARLKVLDLQIDALRKLPDAVAATPAAQQPAATAGAIDLGIRVVLRPAPGVAPAWRQPLLLYSGAIAIALLLAIGFTVLAAHASNTVVNPRDAAALAGAPVVAMLPRIVGSQLRRLSPGERLPANLAIEQPASAFADAMRKALASVRPSGASPQPVCIAIAGAQAGDGASTVSLALARTAAVGGVRVLLIDTDFEDAGLTKAMGIEPAAGIEAILDGDRQLVDLVVEDDMTSVHLLPSAPSEASRGALSLTQLTALKAALASAKNAYEMIIIDCQPHSTRSRTRSMSRMADVALIVAAYNVTKRDVLSAIARRTQQNGAVLRGVLFNFMPDRSRRDQVKFVNDRRAAAMAPPFARIGSDEIAEIRSIH